MYAWMHVYARVCMHVCVYAHNYTKLEIETFWMYNPYVSKGWRFIRENLKMNTISDTINEF